jgi:3-hydroxyisobutyrate dehydrogenase
MAILFIGLGAMGAPMATRLASGDEPVLGFDRDPAAAERVAGVAVARNLDPLPDDVATVVLMVPTSRVVESVLAELFDRLPAGALVIDMSSSEPESTRKLAAAAADRGIGYVDAPVSGGVARAETGELAIMVGGEPADVERAMPVLRRIGSSVHHVGGPGAGDAAKALNNLLTSTNIAAAAEILTAAARFGIAPAAMLGVINASSSRSAASEVKFPKHVLTGTFDSRFSLDLMIKDVGIAGTLTAGLVSPVTDAAHAVVAAAREHAGDPPDHTEIARFYEAGNGVELRG